MKRRSVVLVLVFCVHILSAAGGVEASTADFDEEYRHLLEDASRSMDRLVIDSMPLECSREIEFGRVCSIQVSNQRPTKTYHISYNVTDLLEGHAIRLHVTSLRADRDNPVLFVVKQHLGILSWQLPFQLDSFYEYRQVNRTLCPIINYQSSDSLNNSQDLVVDVSTYSPQMVHVSLLIQWVDFYLQLNQTQTVVISPSAPQYFEMVFPNDTNLLVVTLRSDDDICAVISVQPVDCPVFDLDKNGQFSGSYQTMTQQAAITVKKSDIKGGKFYVVFVVKPSDYECTNIEKIRSGSAVENRTKVLTVTVTKKMTESEYLTATIGAVVFFLLFYVFSIITALVFCVMKRKSRNNNNSTSNANAITSVNRNGIGSSKEPLCYGDETSYGSTSGAEMEATASAKKTGCERSDASASTPDSPFDDESSFDEEDIDMLKDADSDKHILRTKTFLYVVDLARKDPHFLNRKSKLYLWHMFVVAVFYALPVIQLVITYQSVSHVTGNQDICYYNFMCTYPVGSITDFNHVYSNIGYVMLGFLFIGLVWRKDLIHKERMAMNDLYEKNYGIPRHFGLFYAMGTALIMEGILSGSYHVCPNYSNFQFDTSFMYLIASLCMLKIYQTRHPDINANAHASFAVFAVVIFIGVVGVVYGSLYFWIGFAVVHIMACLALSAQIYYMGIWKLNLGIFKRIYLTMKTDLLSATHCCRPMYWVFMISY